MQLHTLKPASGSTKTNKRLGRGQGSGLGSTSTRGHKGDGSRSGHRDKAGFEGGQMPLKLRVPKFGFKNRNRVEYTPVNLALIQSLVDKFNVTTIDLEFLKAHGVISNLKKPVKILANGELSAKIEVKAHKFRDRKSVV